MISIIPYEDTYEDELMQLIRDEGDDWDVYWKEPNASKYRRSFKETITYLALWDGKVCGYSRSFKDALYIYVLDLLVNSKYRGHGIGLQLMQVLQDQYPDLPVYVMSGNDEYYQKIGSKKEGSIYLLKNSTYITED